MLRLREHLRANGTMPLEWLGKRLAIGRRAYRTGSLQQRPECETGKSNRALLLAEH